MQSHYRPIKNSFVSVIIHVMIYQSVTVPHGTYQRFRIVIFIKMFFFSHSLMEIDL